MFNCALSNVNNNSNNSASATTTTTVTIGSSYDDYEDVAGHTSNSSDSVDSVLCDVETSDYDRQHVSLPAENSLSGGGGGVADGGGCWQASSSHFSDDADSMLSDVSKCLASLSSCLHEENDDVDDDDDDEGNEPLSESSSSTLERPIFSSISVRRYSSQSANSSPYLDRRGLISAEGSIIWDEDGDWIQRYDRMLRITGKSRLPPPGQRSCGCVAKRAAAAAAAASASLYDEVPKPFVSHSVGSSPRRGNNNFFLAFLGFLS